MLENLDKSGLLTSEESALGANRHLARSIGMFFQNLQDDDMIPPPQDYNFGLSEDQSIDPTLLEMSTADYVH